MDSFNPFGSSSSSSSQQQQPSSLSSTEIKQQVMHQLRQEASLTQARALIEKVNTNCFTTCVPTPGTSLSGREEKCFTQCMEKYMQAWNIVSRTYVQQMQKMQSGMGGGGGSGFV